MVKDEDSFTRANEDDDVYEVHTNTNYWFLMDIIMVWVGYKENSTQLKFIRNGSSKAEYKNYSY